MAGLASDRLREQIREALPGLVIDSRMRQGYLDEKPGPYPSDRETQRLLSESGGFLEKRSAT